MRCPILSSIEEEFGGVMPGALRDLKNREKKKEKEKKNHVPMYCAFDFIYLLIHKLKLNKFSYHAVFILLLSPHVYFVNHNILYIKKEKFFQHPHATNSNNF